MIHYLENHQIDKAKWDKCIDGAPNGLIYGYSWYLDCMAENWDALIEDDYISVFPLPWKQKYFIKYIYQPFFIQQLGLFCRLPLQPGMVEKYIDAIPKKFLKINLNINVPVQLHGAHVSIVARKNFVLNLNNTYENIYAKYKKDLKKYVAGNPYELIENIDLEDAVHLYIENYSDRHTNIQDVDYIHLIRLLKHLKAIDKLEAIGIIKNGALCAVEVMPVINGRVYCLLGAQNQSGQDIKGLHILIDFVIKKYAGKPFILDFEGSEIASIAYFFSKYGAEPEYYYHLKIKRFPLEKFW